MKVFPLIFSFRDVIQGNGFAATVTMNGRALLTIEDDGDVWLDGVQPGSIGGGGKAQEAALLDFKSNYLSVLFDIANDASTLDAFKAGVQSFFDYTCAVDLETWQATWAAERAAEARSEPPRADLPRVPAAQRPPTVSVVELTASTASPKGNVLPGCEVDAFQAAA